MTSLPEVNILLLQDINEVTKITSRKKTESGELFISWNIRRQYGLRIFI